MIGNPSRVYHSPSARSIPFKDKAAVSTRSPPAPTQKVGGHLPAAAEFSQLEVWLSLWQLSPKPASQALLDRPHLAQIEIYV